MSLEVDIRHRLGGFVLEASFATQGRLTALFGHSGAGKTSLVNIIAGLLRPERGRVAIDGRVLVDTNSGVFVAKHRRHIGYIFQEPRLFPHLSVRRNLLYGSWFTPARERRESFA
ncbi:MAG: ATP-binding cassette domain-containing protein, partial [Stellaceae bacterium]